MKDTIAWLVLDASCTMMLASGGFLLSAAPSVGLTLLGLVATALALGLWSASSRERFALES